MAGKAAPLGHGSCPVRACNGTAFFSLSAGGKVKYSCTYCTSSGYADEGGSAARLFQASATPAAAPAPDPSPGMPPAPAPARSPRNLLDAR